MKEIHPINQHPEFDNRPGAGHHPDGGHRPEKLWPIDKAKMEIIAVIRANGIRAITGPVLRHVLLHLADVVPVRLGELYDITLSDPKEGQQLEYDGEKWVNADPLLSKLFDVLLDSQTNGQVLEWDAEKERWINADPRLSKLFDVLLGTPTKGQILQWDGEKWINADPVITGLFDSVISDSKQGETLEFDGKNWKNAKPLLSKLFDVTISALENNNVLEYDYASGMWKNSSNFYTKSQIDEIIKNAISSVLRFQGTSSSQISDGSTTNPIVVNGKSVTVVQGDVVLYGNKEFVWTGSAWEELGDEASWALKTITITGTGYLTGGGNLSANRSIDLAETYKTMVQHGESAYQKIESGSINNSVWQKMTRSEYHKAVVANSISDDKLYIIYLNDYVSLNTFSGWKSNNMTISGKTVTANADKNNQYISGFVEAGKLKFQLEYTVPKDILINGGVNINWYKDGGIVSTNIGNNLTRQESGINYIYTGTVELDVEEGEIQLSVSYVYSSGQNNVSGLKMTILD